MPEGWRVHIDLPLDVIEDRHFHVTPRRVELAACIESLQGEGLSLLGDVQPPWIRVEHDETKARRLAVVALVAK